MSIQQVYRNELTRISASVNEIVEFGERTVYEMIKGLYGVSKYITLDEIIEQNNVIDKILDDYRKFILTRLCDWQDDKDDTADDEVDFIDEALELVKFIKQCQQHFAQFIDEINNQFIFEEAELMTGVDFTQSSFFTSEMITSFIVFTPGKEEGVEYSSEDRLRLIDEILLQLSQYPTDFLVNKGKLEIKTIQSRNIDKSKLVYIRIY